MAWQAGGNKFSTSIGMSSRETALGFEQPIDRHLSITADYFWKYTSGDYDFDVILNTPLAFPIQWKGSKIDGFSARINFPSWQGLTACTVMGHARSRFFGPEVAA